MKQGSSEITNIFVYKVDTLSDSDNPGKEKGGIPRRAIMIGVGVAVGNIIIGCVALW